MADDKKPTAHDMDEPVKIDLDPEDALRAVMETGPHPDDEPVPRDKPVKDQGDKLGDRS